jgi:anthranilate phosphoribosyltransferase
MGNGFQRDYLLKLLRGEHLTRAEAADLLDVLLAEDSTDAQIAALLTALAAKGETVDEIAGLASGLRSRAVRVNSRHENFIDTAGTGSSAAKTFNVSTAAAFVIAGAGLPVAKHGNRAASSRSGSADVLAALGVNIQASPEQSERSLNQLGICFMFAPLYHGATARVAAIRRQLGVHTTFNLLGPLCNPARAPRQIIGVFRQDLVQLLAEALAALGTTRAWVMHGADGLDEITLAGPTMIAEAAAGAVRTFEVTPEDFGLARADMDQLRGGDTADNSRIIQAVLRGQRRDEARSIVIANAAAALFVGGHAPTLREAAAMAAESIDSGAAQRKLKELAKATTDGNAD